MSVTPTLRCTLIAAALMVGGARKLSGQSTCVVSPHSKGELPSAYVVSKLRPECIADLRTSLVEKNFQRALDVFYDGVRADLLNWVVYIDADGIVTQEMVRGKKQGLTEVRGDRYVWIVVISEHRPSRFCADEKRCPNKKEPAAFRLSRRTIEYRRDPALTTLVGILGRAAGITAPASTGRADSTITISPQNLDFETSPHGLDSLFVATARFALAEDAEASLGVSADTGATYFDGRARRSAFASAHHKIINAAPSLAEVSVAFGGTYAENTPVLTDGTLTGYIEGIQPGLYLTAVFNVFQLPTFPRDPFSAGVGLATNIVPGDLLDDLIIGINVSRFLEGLPVGITAGASWSRAPVKEEGSNLYEDDRVWRPALLFELRL